MIAHQVPVFTRRAKRRLARHPKFHFFDVGIFRTVRPSGPLDTPEEAEGPAVETLALQNLMAVNDVLDLGYKIHYWRTSAGVEVDFVLYGRRGRRLSSGDVAGLRSFQADYPMARCLLVYGGGSRLNVDGVDVIPVNDFLTRLPEILSA
jgi:predicted AAA+ superfamily ATPase